MRLILLPILLIACLLAPAPAQAYSEKTLPPEWQQCQTSDDCTYLKDPKTCEAHAVNTAHAADLKALMEQEKDPGEDNRIKALDGTTRCVNQPEGKCLNNICTLVVHPE